MTDINEQWQDSKEFQTIMEFSKLLIKSGRELKMPEIEISGLLIPKQYMNMVIKEAWMARNK